MQMAKWQNGKSQNHFLIQLAAFTSPQLILYHSVMNWFWYGLIPSDYSTYRGLKWMHEIMAKQVNKIEHKYCSPRDASCWLDLDAELLLSSDCFVWVEVADSEEEGLADFRLDIISSRLLQNNSSRKIHAPKTDSTLWQGFTVLWATKTKHIEKGGPVSGGTCQKKCPMRVLSNVIYMLFT